MLFALISVGMFVFVLLESNEFATAGAGAVCLGRRCESHKIGPAIIANSASEPRVIPTIAPDVRPLGDVGIDVPEATVMSCEVVEGVLWLEADEMKGRT